MKLPPTLLVCLVFLKEAEGWYHENKIENILIATYDIQQQYLVSESGMLPNSLARLTNLSINQTSWMESLALKPGLWELERTLSDLR